MIEEYPMPWLRWSGRVHPHVNVTDSGGPSRVATEQPPEGWEPKPLLGFAPKRVERDPLTWDGDNA